MEDDGKPQPLIFDMARGSFVDGPGIRTVVFFKGCPLRCLWCQNPESQEFHSETFFYEERCIRCGRCSQGCDTLARQEVGKYYSPHELGQLILRDKVFFDTSNGGVTYSGGEPLMFIDYLVQVSELPALKGVHQVVETCGYFDFDLLTGKLIKFIDIFYFDIKIMDPLLHKRYTGKSNRLILENFKKLLDLGKNVLPRIPLIPGYTATGENLAAIADFLLANGVRKYRLLPYNPSGEKKRQRLGREPDKNIPGKPFTKEEEDYWIGFFDDLMTGGLPNKG